MLNLALLPVWYHDTIPMLEERLLRGDDGTKADSKEYKSAGFALQTI
jgi:hypothetical protein